MIRITECGRELATDDSTTNGHEGLASRIKRLGRERAAMMTCVTCFQTAANHLHAWGEESAETQSMARMGFRHTEVVNRELRAFVTLFHAHEDEYRAYYGDDEVDELTARRAERTKARRRGL